MAAFEALLGSELLGKNGAVSTSTALAGKEVVGLYFSAHWCPPCRGFTPVLADIYKKVSSSGKPFEIVFVSSDREEEAFAEYFGEQPWLALPFKARELKAKLSARYKVRGIPSLVLLDAAGEVITLKGREAVAGDPEAFPWKPPTLAEALTGPVMAKDGSETSVEAMRAAGVKYLMLYFSAHWCPPCKAFTPKLASVYSKLKERGVPMEGIFVSSDRDEASFMSYWGDMPWAAIALGDKRKETLSSYFEVEGIPTLVTLELCADGSVAVVNKDARGPASGDASGERFPWPPPPVADFDEDPNALNEGPALAVLAEKAANLSEIEAALEEASKARKASAGADPVAFGMFQELGGGIGAQVRKLCALGQPKPQAQAVLLNLPDGGAYYELPADADLAKAATYTDWLARFDQGDLPKRSVEQNAKQ